MPFGMPDPEYLEYGVKNMNTKAKPRCDQCAELVIQGVRCHETGCPRAKAFDCPMCKEETSHKFYALCRECATRQAEYEATEQQNSEQGDEE